MVSSTADPNVAAKFTALRHSSGAEHRGKRPANVIEVECDLSYPYSSEIREGTLFVAQAMEDKWDIYWYDAHFYFARSWTGALAFRAGVHVSPSHVAIRSIDAHTEFAAAGPASVICQVDFLLKSHLFNQLVPHPLPADLPEDKQTIALYSFSQYGRRAAFASFEDTSKIQAR